MVVDAPHAAGAPTPPLLCSLAQCHKLRLHDIMPIVTAFLYFFLGISLGHSMFIVNWNVSSLSLPETDYIIRLFSNDARERLWLTT